MASSVLQVEVDEEILTQATAIYEALGIDIQTAIRIFLKKSVVEKGLPFEMTLTGDKEIASNPAPQTMRNAKKAAISDETVEELKTEIAAAWARMASP